MSFSTTLRALAAAATLAAVTAGCGSSSPPNSSSSAGSGPQNAVSAAYRYAGCMRDHGVSNFPDPHVTENATQTQIAMMAPGNPKSPQVASAIKACRGILPQPQNVSPAQRAAQQQKQRADILSFARCMRSRGIQNFPDPTNQGQLQLQTIAAAGVDLHTQTFEKAALTCIPAAHGILTPAAVRAVVNGTAPGSGSGSGSNAGSASGSNAGSASGSNAGSASSSGTG